MSDPRNNPPPDDWAKTRANINIPDADIGSESNDWDKTNYNFPKQPDSGGDWGKTVTNIKPIDTGRHDFGQTNPGSSSQPDADWAATRANINVPDTDFGPPPAAAEGGYDKTTPYFKLPEAERAKYQSLPPTAAETAAQEEKDKKAKGGIPSWVWVSAGFLAMFMFAILVLVFVYFFMIRGTSFDATVKSAPPGSDIKVDDVPWGVTSEDGSIKLVNLKAGRRTIKIEHPNYTCETRDINGGNGVTPEPIIARCSQVAVKATDDCANIRPGEEDKAERCYYAALEALPKPPEQFTAEQLVKALSILIINFESGKFDIPPKRLAALQKGAEYIRRVSPPDTVLEVGGHTDSVGSAASNKTLSENRAEAVKKVLVGYGVRGEVLQTRGYGPDKPKSDNSTDLGKFYNRRIEYAVVKK